MCYTTKKFDENFIKYKFVRGGVIMAISKEELLKKAIQLSPVDRAQLVEAILSTFSFKDRKEIDEAWALEIDDRIHAYEKGLIEKISYEEIFSSLSS